MSRVAAVIVLYHPEPYLLDRLVKSMAEQVETAYIIDNTPKPSSKVVQLLNGFHPLITYKALGDNLGIALAQNMGIREALRQGYSHVLLLDQDSALSNGMVHSLIEAEARLIAQGNKVAAVGPLYVDEKTGKTSPAIRTGALRAKYIAVDASTSEPVGTDYVIASGSLIQSTTIETVGMMREELFIDWVDIEWGLRAKFRGYNSYVIPNALLQHSIGDTTVRVFGKTLNVHSDIRHFYIVRNAAYLLRFRTMGWRWRILTTLRLPRYLVAFSWLSKAKLKSSVLLVRALIHGFCARTGRFEP